MIFNGDSLPSCFERRLPDRAELIDRTWWRESGVLVFTAHAGRSRLAEVEVVVREQCPAPGSNVLLLWGAAPRGMVDVVEVTKRLVEMGRREIAVVGCTFYGEEDADSWIRLLEALESAVTDALRDTTFVEGLLRRLMGAPGCIVGGDDREQALWELAQIGLAAVSGEDCHPLVGHAKTEVGSRILKEASHLAPEEMARSVLVAVQRELDQRS
jgi:hypothetical protein